MRYQQKPFVPLPNTCNKILSTGIFPDRLKYSEIKPLFKKGDKTSISIYRPISFHISLCNIIEEITYKRLYDHININYILVKEQFGFRTNSFAEIAAYILINNILSSLDNKLLVGRLFNKKKKAFYFYCLNHEILSKMRFYGI
jgi:hypothetical protein